MESYRSSLKQLQSFIRFLLNLFCFLGGFFCFFLLFFLFFLFFVLFICTWNAVTKCFSSQLAVGEDRWSVYRRYRRFRELHRQTVAEYPIVSVIVHLDCVDDPKMIYCRISTCELVLHGYSTDRNTQFRKMLLLFQVHSLEFPSKRYFGNRAETFVRVRRAQLEVDLFYVFIYVVFQFVRNISHLIKIARTKEVKFG